MERVTLPRAAAPPAEPLEIAVLRTAADLAALRAGRVPAGVLRVELPGLSADEARYVAARLALLRGECGCAMGAALAYPFLVAAAAWQVIHPRAFADTLTGRIGVVLAAAVAAALIGKGFGILRARLRLRWEIDALGRRLGLAR